MYGIDVRAAHDSTLIFTVTEQSREPWGAANSTILVPAEQLEPLISKLQARLQEVQELRAATPVFATGQQVRITGGPREGQHGKVIEITQKEARLERMTGERWLYTVYFDDGMTWAYRADELE